MFRNEGKLWSKVGSGKRGDLEPFGPSLGAFPAEVSSCFFPASSLPTAPAGISFPIHPSRPSPSSVPVTAVLRGCGATTGLSRVSQRAGGAWRWFKGLGEQRFTGSFSPVAPPAGRRAQPISSSKRGAEVGVPGFGAGDCARRAQAPLEKPFRVGTPGTPALPLGR